MKEFVLGGARAYHGSSDRRFGGDGADVEPSKSAPEGQLLALARHTERGVAFCRDGRVRWANARLVQWVDARGAEDLVGRPIESLLEDGSHRLRDAPMGVAVSCRLRCAGGLRDVEVLRFRDEDGERDELWLLRDLAPSREELLGVVSHELRTPLTVIRGYNNLLLGEDAGPLTDAQREFLEQSNRSCERLAQFIRDLLSACADPAAQAPLELRNASIESLLDDVIAFLRPLLDERDLVVEKRLDPDARRAHFDPVRIEQVLCNLLANALRFSKPGTAVRVGSRSVADSNHRLIEVSVVDTGPGVPLADRERVFEPYVRTTQDQRGSGLGLGLAICRRIVNAHGGSIGVGEEPGFGARFFFSLPAADEEAG
jgi:signal transduction histidine kinase